MRAAPSLNKAPCLNQHLTLFCKVPVGAARGHHYAFGLSFVEGFCRKGGVFLELFEEIANKKTVPDDAVAFDKIGGETYDILR